MSGSEIIRFDITNIGGVGFAADGQVVGEITPAVPGEVVEVVDERDAEAIVTMVSNIRRALDAAKLIEKLCKDAEAHVLARYGDALESFTLDSVKKGKKSIDLAAGTIGHRASKEKLGIDDDETAAKVLHCILTEEQYEEAVRMVPKVLITKIPPEVIDDLKDNFGEGVIPDSDVAAGFKYDPPGDKFYIKERS